MTYAYHPISGLHTVTTRYGRFTAFTRAQAMSMAERAERRDIRRALARGASRQQQGGYTR